jgi:hypothetical protein
MAQDGLAAWKRKLVLDARRHSAMLFDGKRFRAEMEPEPA